MVEEQSRIIGKFVLVHEVLKDKGIFTDDEVKAKYEQINKEREERAKAELDIERQNIADASNKKAGITVGCKENPADNAVQPAGTGDHAGDSPDGITIVLSPKGN